ncbi:electron transfer flavoprotein subunit beta/FixA family protein [Pirellulales bacterium]|nr:electron transfer flavoprotein subunit beta/FixA family protein [Pirellulales bacterium]
MKILTPIKRVPDADQKIRPAADGTSVDLAGLPHVVNPFDAIALEEAVRIREHADADAVEVVAVGIGAANYHEQLRTALALGADRAAWVSAPDPLDPWNVAAVLKGMVDREQPDIVLMGKQAVDDDSNQAGQFLAAQLNWPQATFASKIELLANSARVSRETDRGIEVVTVNLPAVITVDLRLNEPRYASLPSILRAKKKPIEEVSAEELGIAFQPRVRVLRTRVEESERKCIRVTNVRELIAALQSETTTAGEEGGTQN